MRAGQRSKTKSNSATHQAHPTSLGSTNATRSSTGRGRTSRRNGKLTKSAFVRAQPPRATALEVIAAGRKLGLELEAAYIYKVRARLHKKQRGGGPAVSRSNVGDDTAFRRLVVALGVLRAEELIAEVKRKLEGVFAKT
jgi:hypothetical protein